MKIEQLAEKPREKALRKGFSELSDTELLALVIESGTKNCSAFDLSMKVLSMVGNINQLPQLSLSELKSLPGIKNAKALRILGCIELSKRLQSTTLDQVVISSNKDVYDFYASQLIHEKQEHFRAMYLDSKHRVIREKMLFLGSLDCSLVHPREVFKEALHLSASSIIVVHNHPSGDPTPSKQDIEITSLLNQTGQIMQIPLLDHIIIGHQSFYSFREGGLL